MEEKLEAFKRHGKKDEPVEVKGNEVLEAIAEGWDIDIAYAVIDGDLHIRAIADRIRDEDGKLTVRGNVKIQQSEIRGYASFISATFSGNADFREATFSGNADFREATFSGYASFISATFSGDASFISATFNGDAYFMEATFRKASFMEATFSRDTSFISARFSGDASFTSARFNGDADFIEATFTKASFVEATFRKASFSSTIFSGDASFMSARFSGDTVFISATFSGNAYFMSAIFSGVASFMSARFSGDAYFIWATFSWNADLHVAFKRNAVFDGVLFDRGVNLDEAHFPEDFPPKSFADIGLAYRKSLLSGAGDFFKLAGETYWKQERPQCSEASECFLNARVEYDKEGKYDEAARMYVEEGKLYRGIKKYSEASESFRNAKIEYEKSGKYREAGHMHIEEQQSIRQSLGKGNHAKRAWFWVWKYSSRYGESPWWFIGWIAFIVVFFALIYLPIISNWLSWWPSITFEKYPYHPWKAGIIDGFLFNIVTAIYFSAVTFATLGFGDISPLSIVGKCSTVVQVLLGYLMFGVLITLVARKMTRS
jgi:uncharacterized protein YjbI with pentapeptide repeats